MAHHKLSEPLSQTVPLEEEVLFHVKVFHVLFPWTSKRKYFMLKGGKRAEGCKGRTIRQFLIFLRKNHSEIVIVLFFVTSPHRVEAVLLGLFKAKTFLEQLAEEGHEWAKCGRDNPHNLHLFKLGWWRWRYSQVQVRIASHHAWQKILMEYYLRNVSCSFFRLSLWIVILNNFLQILQ